MVARRNNRAKTTATNRVGDNSAHQRYHPQVRLLLVAALLSLCCTACSSEPSVSLVLIPGQETDAFTRDPKPTQLEVALVSGAGRQTVASLGWPTGSFDVGDLSVDSFAAFEAVGRVTSGDAVLWGRTLPLKLGSLGGAEVPVFLGRVGELARPPGSLPASHNAGVAGIVDGQLLVATGGTRTIDSSGASISTATATAYDLGLWGPLSSTPVLPRTAATLAIVNLRYGLVIDSEGASWVDFDSATNSDASAPAGMKFSDIAGAIPVLGEDGAAYIVGGTRRQGEATTAVLRAGSDLSLTALTLTAARKGAGAAWIAGRGLVVVGGSTEAGGAEELPNSAAAFRELPFGAEPVFGAGATALDATHVLMAGGVDDKGKPGLARAFDLSCTSACTAQPLAGSEATGLESAAVWGLSSSKALVLGTALPAEPDAGLVRVVMISVAGQSAQTKLVPLREPRSGAVGVALPLGTIALVGGVSPAQEPVRSIELFIPPQ